MSATLLSLNSGDGTGIVLADADHRDYLDSLSPKGPDRPDSLRRAGIAQEWARPLDGGRYLVSKRGLTALGIDWTARPTTLRRSSV